MKAVHSYDLKKQIADDFGVSLKREYVLRLPANKKNMKMFTMGEAGAVRIFDGTNEHPYMLPGKRNDEKLKTGIELRKISEKTLSEIIKETGAKVKTEGCKVCEGGGWYSNGTRYIYKEIYCEL